MLRRWHNVRRITGETRPMETAQALLDRVLDLDIDTWRPQILPASSEHWAAALEEGRVLCLARLPFLLSDSEKGFLSASWLSGKRKNISLDGDRVAGAGGTPETMQSMVAMIKRYAGQATDLVTRLFPAYKNHLNQARTSFRPGIVEHSPRSWRKDDSRLHVAAFPSRPNHGERILRVFTNVNDRGSARVWRVGEPFAAAARRFLPAIARPL